MSLLSSPAHTLIAHHAPATLALLYSPWAHENWVPLIPMCSSAAALKPELQHWAPSYHSGPNPDITSMERYLSLSLVYHQSIHHSLSYRSGLFHPQYFSLLKNIMFFFFCLFFHLTPPIRMWFLIDFNLVYLVSSTRIACHKIEAHLTFPEWMDEWMNKKWRKSARE